MRTVAPIDPTLPPKRPRLGCLGCFGQCTLVLILSGLGYLGLMALFTPWGFYLGGNFHINPQWQGLGRFHSSRGGDYVLYLSFGPKFGGNRYAKFPSSSLSGTAYLCSPRHERFRLRVGGDMRAHLPTMTDGEAVSLYMNHHPIWNYTADPTPRISIRGHWQNPNLAADDHGSIWNAFEPDGRLYKGHDPNRPYAKEIIPITFTPATFSDFEAACPTP